MILPLFCQRMILYDILIHMMLSSTILQHVADRFQSMTYSFRSPYVYLNTFWRSFKLLFMQVIQRI